MLAQVDYMLPLDFVLKLLSLNFLCPLPTIAQRYVSLPQLI